MEVMVEEERIEQAGGVSASAGDPWAPVAAGEALATSRQIAFALDLLARHHEPLIHNLLPKPSRAQVAELSKDRCSELIDVLRSDRRNIEPPLSRASLEEIKAEYTIKLADFDRWREEDGWHLSESQAAAQRSYLSSVLERVRGQLSRFPD